MKAPPKSLLSKRTEELKLPPRKLLELFICTDCGSPLERMSTHWVCTRKLGCGKMLTDGGLLEMLETLMRGLGYQRWTPKGILSIQRRVCRWVQKLQVYTARAKNLKRHLAKVIRGLAKNTELPPPAVTLQEERDEL